MWFSAFESDRTLNETYAAVEILSGITWRSSRPAESTITEAITGLSYQLQMMMMMTVEWLAEDIGENVNLCRFLHHKYHMSWTKLEPGPPRWKADD
jgi:hypothetical protein